MTSPKKLYAYSVINNFVLTVVLCSCASAVAGDTADDDTEETYELRVFLQRPKQDALKDAGVIKMYREGLCAYLAEAENNLVSPARRIELAKSVVEGADLLLDRGIVEVPAATYLTRAKLAAPDAQLNVTAARTRAEAVLRNLTNSRL